MSYERVNENASDYWMNEKKKKEENRGNNSSVSEKDIEKLTSSVEKSRRIEEENLDNVWNQ